MYIKIITALMVNSLVPLLNLFVNYFSNESSKSLNELENHPDMFMLEFYYGGKGFINKAFLSIVYEESCLLYLQSTTKFLSFAVIVFQNLSQVTCGHFAGTNQNGCNKQGSRKKLGNRNLQEPFSSESRDLSACTRLLKDQRLQMP